MLTIVNMPLPKPTNVKMYQVNVGVVCVCEARTRSPCDTRLSFAVLSAMLRCSCTLRFSNESKLTAETGRTLRVPSLALSFSVEGPDVVS